MSVDVFLNFNGNCKEAVEFYARVFDCEQPKFMTFGEVPAGQDFPPLPDELKSLIMYTELHVEGSKMMFSDVTPSMHLEIGNNINITVGTKDINKIKTWFDRLKEGGSVHMEPQKTFWSDCYCMLVDKFGIPWQLSHDSGKY